MGKLLILIFGMTSMVLSSCTNNNATPNVNPAFIGNWLAVDATNNPIVVEWGLFYTASVKLRMDNSFLINLGTGIDSNKGNMGTWKLNGDSIVFYSVYSSGSDVQRNTTVFNISIDSKNELVLKNKLISIRHRKLNN